jgi:hypothetical protein
MPFAMVFWLAAVPLLPAVRPAATAAPVALGIAPLLIRFARDIAAQAAQRKRQLARGAPIRRY